MSRWSFTVAALAAVAAVLVGVVGADPDPEPAPTSSVPFVSLRDAGSTSYRTSFSPYRFAYYDWERHAPHWSLTPDDRYVLAYRPYVKNGVHHDWFSAPPPPTDHRRNGYYDAAASSGDYYDRFYSYDLEEATRPRSLGQGQIRVSGRQAEISCHFPAHLDIVSNVIWQRIDDGSSGSGSYYWHGGDRLHSDGRTTIRQYPTGSTLYIADFGVRDFGLYRCSASQSVYVRGRSAPTTRTLYQQVFFEGLNN